MSIVPYYDRGGIVIFCCDWREIPHEELSAQLLFTDPPYGLGEAAGKNKSRSKLAIAKDYGNMTWDDEPVSDFDLITLRGLTRWQIIWGGNYFVLPPSKCWLVWDKVNSGDFADCELAWTNFDKAVRLFRWMWNGMIKEQPEERWHIAQKPLALFKWALTQAPKDVETVLDPFGGVGTTAVACKALGLKCIVVEQVEEYCQRAAIRLEQEVFEFPEEKLDFVQNLDFSGEKECTQNTTTP